jgi:hypothetical protein
MKRQKENKSQRIVIFVEGDTDELSDLYSKARRTYSKGYATHEMIKNLDLSKIRVKRQSVLNELEEALDVKW